MFVHEAITSKLVEQALPLMPYLDDGKEFATYDLLVEWKDRYEKKGGSEPENPNTWSAPISAPLLPNIVNIGHEQVYAALGAVAFHDPENSPWGHATRDLQQWLLLPENVSGLEHKPSDAAAVAVVLAAVYGEKGHLLLAEANRYLEPSRDEGETVQARRARAS
ncbi:hypothetical protein [Streptomyces sp. MJM1172]|uniref:hypothetical protein n=1 Tax=Streptomyces sp. MJM1172 TaxID=1703926 RepID=UPI00093F00B6|nr:hypothetical protein [Streptomyces sp. MJM1172]OKI61538.1 hypothetical protein AMK15_18665 [Streptomyces sp. MJM1172]